MKIKSFIFSLYLVIAFFASTVSAEYRIYALQENLCSQWVPLDDSTPEQDQYTAAIQKFWSSGAVYLYARQSKTLPHFDNNSFSIWMNQYCQKNQTASISEAVQEFFIALSNSKSATSNRFKVDHIGTKKGVWPSGTSCGDRLSYEKAKPVYNVWLGGLVTQAGWLGFTLKPTNMSSMSAYVDQYCSENIFDSFISAGYSLLDQLIISSPKS